MSKIKIIKEIQKFNQQKLNLEERIKSSKIKLNLFVVGNGTIENLNGMPFEMKQIIFAEIINGCLINGNFQKIKNLYIKFRILFHFKTIQKLKNDLNFQKYIRKTIGIEYYDICTVYSIKYYLRWNSDFLDKKYTNILDRFMFDKDIPIVTRNVVLQTIVKQFDSCLFNNESHIVKRYIQENYKWY